MGLERLKLRLEPLQLSFDLAVKFRNGLLGVGPRLVGGLNLLCPLLKLRFDIVAKLLDVLVVLLLDLGDISLDLWPSSGRAQGPRAQLGLDDARRCSHAHHGSS